MKHSDKWLFEITPKKSLFEFNFREIYQFKDLLTLFVRRDIVAVYKQTVLGPLWFVINPILTSLIQFVVFGKIASIETDGAPYFIFVLAGNTIWSFFSSTLTSTSNTFMANQGIFGKVYFPRAIMPISVTISNLFKFLIQLSFFLVVLIVSNLNGIVVKPNLYILFTPLMLLIMGMTGMGLGMIITSLTTKYRDFQFLLSFGVSLFMYLTPVVYPTSLAIQQAPVGYEWLIYVNPLTGILDLFRYAFLNEGSVHFLSILWSFSFGVMVYLVGLLVFNRTEKSFMDTI